MKITDPRAKIFQKYIEDKKIVIADTSAVSRTSLAGLLNSMGAKQGNISLVPNYQMAEAEIENRKPHIVICDYDLGKKCGLDLLQMQRQQNPDFRNSLFILVTGNTSQSAVAKAAEEDIDTFILKPFTADTLRASILKTALAKIDPPQYVKVIERGKNELADGKFDDAIATFEYARTLDPLPSLACFYLGQANLLKAMFDGAQGSYQKGLEYNKIHYKCMVGLYEVLMTKKMHTEAYDVIKRISHYFPANPQRLTAVLRLAIVTKSYDDVERYYRVFTNIDTRNEEMIKYVCAALVVCGKYYLQKNFGTRALELFQKAAATASGRTRILREIVLSLVEYGMVKEAEKFLQRFLPESRTGPDFSAMELLVLDKTAHRSTVIEKGRELLTKNIFDPVIYQILIRKSVEAGLIPAAEDLVRTARQRWPDQGEQFENAFRNKEEKRPNYRTG
jgi:two-component system chemotaxis response regulator CheY